MKVLITGGGGFLGSFLAHNLLRRGKLIGKSGELEPIDEIRLLDNQFKGRSKDARIVELKGDLSDREFAHTAIGTKSNSIDGVFHLASMVSGECELNFDQALLVNLDGGRYLLEAARREATASRFVFASSIACFGGTESESIFSDRSKLLPRTTYGTTKAIFELLVNDYSRKGFIDGRSARLPTVIIRPGRPNAAASSWASGMLREPLAGEPCFLPVRRDQSHPMSGYRTVIDSLIKLYEISGNSLGFDRAVGFPALKVTPIDAETAIQRFASREGMPIGEIIDEPNDTIQKIVDGWATEIDGSRALALGLPMPPSLDEIISEYLEDFPKAKKTGESKEAK
jgi:nucleoside-diphosphate-sugar epimerase